MAEKRAILEYHAHEWFVDGETPVEILTGERLPYATLLFQIVEDAGSIIESTLRHSDSAVCLAGRASGEAATRRALADFRFRLDEEEADLSQLISVHEWHPGMVSRVTFFNTRTGNVDRQSDPPAVVVADGGGALLRSLATTRFDDGDILGVVRRDADLNDLEEVALRVGALSQWYGEDGDTASALPTAPHGVVARVLCRRQT